MGGENFQGSKNIESSPQEKQLRNGNEQIIKTTKKENYNEEKHTIDCKYDEKKKQVCEKSKESEKELLKNYSLSMRKETSILIKNLKQIDTDFNPLNFSEIQKERKEIYQKLISPSFKHLLKHSKRNLEQDIKNYLHGGLGKILDYDEEILDSLLKAKEQQSKFLMQYDKKLSPELNNTIYNYIDENIIKYKQESQIQEQEKQTRIFGAKDKLKIFETLKKDYLNTVYAKNIDIDNTNPDFGMIGNLHGLLERLENGLNKIQNPETLEKDDFKDTFTGIWNTLWDIIHILRNFSYESLNTILEVCKNSVHKLLYDISPHKAGDIEKWIQDLPENPYFDMRLTYQVANAGVTGILDSGIFLTQIYLKANLKPGDFVGEIKNEGTLIIKDFTAWISKENLKKLGKSILTKLKNEPEESITNTSYIAGAVTGGIMLPKHMNMREWPSLWKTGIHLGAKGLDEGAKITIISYYLSRQKTLEWKIKNLEKKFGFSDEARQYHYKEFENIKRQFERMKRENREAKRYRKVKKAYEKKLPNKHLWEINKSEIIQERKSIQTRISKYTQEKENVTNKVNALNKQKEALHIEIEDFLNQEILNALKKEGIIEKMSGLPNERVNLYRFLEERKTIHISGRGRQGDQREIRLYVEKIYNKIYSAIQKDFRNTQGGNHALKSSIQKMKNFSPEQKKHLIDTISGNTKLPKHLKQIQDIYIGNKRKQNKIDGLKGKIQANKRKDTLLNKQESYLRGKLNTLQNQEKELRRIEKKIENFYNRLQRYAKRTEEFQKYDSRERTIIHKENIEFQKILGISDSNPKGVMSVENLEKYFDSYQKSNQYLILQKRAENFYTSQKGDHIKELQNYKTLYDENTKLLSQAKNVLGTQLFTKAEQALQSSREIFGEKIFQTETIGKSIESGRQKTENIVADVEKSVSDIMKYQYFGQEVISEVKKKVNDSISKQRVSLDSGTKIDFNIEKQIQSLEKLGIPRSFSRDILESGLGTPLLTNKEFNLLKRYEGFNKKGIDYNKMISSGIDRVEKITGNRLTKEEALIIFTYTDYFLYQKLNRFMRGDQSLLNTMTKENIKVTKNVISKLESALKKMPDLVPGKNGFIFRGDRIKYWEKNIGKQNELKGFTSVSNNKNDILLGGKFKNNTEISILGKKGKVKDISYFAIGVHFGDIISGISKTRNEGVILLNSKVILLEKIQGTDTYYIKVKQIE